MTTTDLAPAVPAADSTRRPVRRPVDWRRVVSPTAAIAYGMAAIAALGTAAGSVLAGRLAEHPTTALVAALALCLVGGALLDTIGRTLWAGVVDRAEGRLRADLLVAALDQPLAVLGEQAAGEILDRVDDDTHEVGTLLRRQVWDAVSTLLTTVPLWVVAGLTWWPAFVLFPIVGMVALAAVRRILPELTARKVIEEAAWTDHAAAMEEGVAARDDLRTSLGQAHVLRRCAELSARIHERFARVVRLESLATLRTGCILHAFLAGTAVVGVALVLGDALSTAGLVTLFLVTSTYVGQVDGLARQLPDLQAGFGAVVRLRGLMDVEPEPRGGRPVPDGRLSIAFDGLDFAYPHGSFALHDIDLRIPAGTTCALVGRTGSGKSTLAALLTRAVDPPPGSVLLGGVDVRTLDLQDLRRTVGVITQRTEILAGSLAENIALFADLPPARIAAAVTELDLAAWVEGLPDGLATRLGPGGTTLSAGEEQLVAFARLLVRDVRVVVLDEATARMDPLTEARVVAAAERLLAGRTGILIAHRLTTTARADSVAVLDAGRIVQQGARDALARRPGAFHDLLAAAGADSDATSPSTGDRAIGTARRTTTPPAPPALAPAPGLARATMRAVLVEKRWGLASVVLFLAMSMTGAFGVVTASLWGRTIAGLHDGGRPLALTGMLVLSLLVCPILLAVAVRRYARWWIALLLRVRIAVLAGQIATHRLARTPPGEVVARAMDADRWVRYTDRSIDLVSGLIIALLTMLIAWSPLAGGLLLGVMGATATGAVLGRRVAGRTAAASSTARARFGRSLVSALESVRTVKLAAATWDVHRHLHLVDSVRVRAAVREHRVQAMLDGVPTVLVQCAIVGAWAVLVGGGWDLATTLLVVGTVAGFDWFGTVAGAVITQAPGTRAWLQATSEFAGGGDLIRAPDGIELVSGRAPPPAAAIADRLRTLQVRGLTAVHDDGTVGVSDVDLDVSAGELVLLVGQVGSGKSSLLGALAGLVSSTGELSWNDRPVLDRQAELRPGRVAHVAQVPRVLSGTFTDNIRLDHPNRQVGPALTIARLGPDVAAAGGPDALVGHRGVRLSGGQVQRLALARAVATDAELLLADDVSSALDAATELELWQALRERASTVVGATSKAAALRQADRVVVLVEGRVAAVGPWSELAGDWGRLAG